MPPAPPSVQAHPSPQQVLDGARQLGVLIDGAQAAQLVAYLVCLERWNRVHALSAWKLPTDLLVHHVLDSMTLVGPLSRYGAGKPLRILDAGSGAGFPAVVLAVSRAEWSVTAVDAVAKKVAFIQQATMEAGIGNLSARHARLEELQVAKPFDVVVSRAFASLDRFVALTEHLLAPDGVWVAQKGRRSNDETIDLRKGVEVFHVEPVTVPGLEAERHLVWMRRDRR